MFRVAMAAIAIAAAMPVVTAVPTAASAAETTQIAVASNGAKLPQPDLNEIDCPEMSTLLQKYSGSGYRGPEPLGAGHPDSQIFAYENELATIFYEECQAGTTHFQDSSPIFGHGFSN